LVDFNAPKFLSELKDNTMSRFHQVIGWSFATSIAIYGLITAFGFLTFGAASNGKSFNVTKPGSGVSLAYAPLFSTLSFFA
jgi:amino acid permease